MLATEIVGFQLSPRSIRFTLKPEDGADSMAIEQELYVDVQPSDVCETEPGESARWIGENVLVETPPTVLRSPPRFDGAGVRTGAETGDIRVDGTKRDKPALTPGIGLADSQRHPWWKSAASKLRVVTPLLLADLFVIGALLAAASSLAGDSLGAALQPSLTMIVCVLLALIVGRHAEGLYPGVGLNIVVELRKQTIATTVVFAVLAMSWFAAGQFNVAMAFFLLFAYLAIVVALPLCRYLTQALLGKTSWWGFPVLIFGCGPTARRVLLAMRNSPSRGLRPVGCVGMPSEIFRDRHGIGAPVHVDDFLGNFDDAPRLIDEHKVHWVIGVMPEEPATQVARLVSLYAARAPYRLLTTGISDFPYLWQVVRDCGGEAGIEIRDGLLIPSRQLFKRAFDLCAVLAGGLVISPLLLAIALAIKLGSRGPVFYGQKRVGYGGKEMTIWKFRSMFVNADAVLREYLDNDAEIREEWERTHKLQNDPRITRIGRFLRASSLDELPQLWNILRGEMSLVGPRPIVDHAHYDREYVTDYPEAYQLYLRVRPGITGLWQVAGRRHRNYYLRPQLDAYYVRNWSVWLDLFLLTRTVKTVLRREGAS